MRRQDDNTERDKEIRAEELEQGTAAETGSEQQEIITETTYQQRFTCIPKIYVGSFLEALN